MTDDNDETTIETEAAERETRHGFYVDQPFSLAPWWDTPRDDPRTRGALASLVGDADWKRGIDLVWPRLPMSERTPEGVATALGAWLRLETEPGDMGGCGSIDDVLDIAAEHLEASMRWLDALRALQVVCAANAEALAYIERRAVLVAAGRDIEAARLAEYSSGQAMRAECRRLSRVLAEEIRILEGRVVDAETDPAATLARIQTLGRLLEGLAEMWEAPPDGFVDPRWDLEEARAGVGAIRQSPPPLSLEACRDDVTLPEIRVAAAVGGEE